MKGFLRERIRIRWHIVETPAMVKKAKELENDELRFFDNLELAQKEFCDIDLVLSSGAIQCVPNPYRTLNELIDCEAHFLLLSRLCLTTGERDIITVHETTLGANGPGPLPDGMPDKLCQFPVQIIRKQQLDSMISQRYKILIEFDDKSGVVKVENEPVVGLGYFSERLGNE